MDISQVRKEMHENFLWFAEAYRVAAQSSQPHGLAHSLPFIAESVHNMSKILISSNLEIVEDMIKPSVIKTWDYVTGSGEDIILMSCEEMEYFYPVFLRCWRLFMFASSENVKDLNAKKLARIGLDFIHNSIADFLIRKIEVAVSPERVIMIMMNESGIIANVRN